MTHTLHDLLIAVSALCHEPMTRERWLADGNLRIRLMPMDTGWQRIDVFDLTQLSADTRGQVKTLSKGHTPIQRNPQEGHHVPPGSTHATYPVRDEDLNVNVNREPDGILREANT
jgi:hypothetical protein